MIEEDRRIFSRFAIRLTVKYFFSEAQVQKDARTVDVSANGISIITEDKLEPGTSVEVWLHIPNVRQDIYTKGSIIWSDLTELADENQYRCGISLDKPELMGIALALREIRENHKDIRPNLS